jgi:hypothetical protein
MVKFQNYGSAADNKIYQSRPLYSQPSRFKPKGWTSTTLGYLNESKKLTMCLLRNRSVMDRPYTWAVHVNLNVELPTKAVTSTWLSACRKLRRRGIVCLWVREPNKSNKVHYHLIIKNAIGKKELEQAIEDAMPNRSEVKWRKRVEPIKSEWHYAHYLTKAKISGFLDGRKVDDLYGRKRLLFKANLNLKKYGVIGDFWERPKKRLWDEIRDKERRIAEGLERPNVRRLANHVYEMLGATVALTRIERSFGLRADSNGVQDWIESLFAGDQ